MKDGGSNGYAVVLKMTVQAREKVLKICQTIDPNLIRLSWAVSRLNYGD